MINDPITITNAATISDGGTKYLIGSDSDGNEFSILIAQYILPNNFASNQIPGRLHLNDEPIHVRSNSESALIQSLEKCLIKVESNELFFSKGLKQIKNSKNLMEANAIGHAYGVAYLIKCIIDFVQSDKYIEIAKKFNTYT